MNTDSYLEAIEDAHRRRCERFCYTAAMRDGRSCISIVEAGKPGHYPLSEDYFAGTEAEAYAEAAKLNRERLDIGPREASVIVASSMADWKRS